jgi:MoxR-like ATPase
MNDNKIQINGNTIEQLNQIISETEKVVIGQSKIIKRVLLGLITGGHILLEGVPGLAKTTILKTISKTLKLKFNRIQFTPDLLPADIIGTQIYDKNSASFILNKGPAFTNILLGDEINRAPAKTQSALLEVMQEKQVTIGNETLKLDEPFLVLATQNPIEQEGTYQLPEAQVDRFMLKIKISYPEKFQETEILNSQIFYKINNVKEIISFDSLKKLQETIKKIYIEPKLNEYIVDIIDATRYPEKYGLFDLKNMIFYGASPRASIWTHVCSKGIALMNKRNYVIPEDIHEIIKEVLRHRIILSYEAQAENITVEDIIDKIVNKIKIP